MKASSSAFSLGCRLFIIQPISTVCADPIGEVRVNSQESQTHDGDLKKTLAFHFLVPPSLFENSNNQTPKEWIAIESFYFYFLIFTFNLSSQLLDDRQDAPETGLEALPLRGQRVGVPAQGLAVVRGDPVEVVVLIQQHPVADFRAGPFVQVLDHLSGEHRALHIETGFGVDSGRASVEVEAADEHVLAIEHDRLRVYSRLGALQNLLLPQRARFPAHLVDLHARPNQVFAADGISGEGGQDIVGGERVGNDADP